MGFDDVPGWDLFDTLFVLICVGPWVLFGVASILSLFA